MTSGDPWQRLQVAAYLHPLQHAVPKDLPTEIRALLVSYGADRPDPKKPHPKKNPAVRCGVFAANLGAA